jgi:hypothetical protein
MIHRILNHIRHNKEILTLKAILMLIALAVLIYRWPKLK